VLAGLAAMLLGTPWRRARAADVEVPIPLQIELMARVVKYDRNAIARMGTACRLLIVRRANDAASKSAAKQARTELARLADIAGLPVHVTEHDYEDADKLVAACEAQGIGVVLVTPGLSDVVAGMGSAFTDRSMLTVSLLASDVLGGAVLGFALESSRPTIVVHVRQARRQNVDFSARLLAIAKVVG